VSHRAPSPAHPIGSGVDPTGKLVGRLDELLARAEAFLPVSSCEALRDARERLSQQRLNLVVVGEFKRGKSSLVNALLGRDLLPTGVVPLTSIVTTVAYAAADTLRVRFRDGSEDVRPIGELADYVTEASNPNNRRGVHSAQLAVDSDLLTGGLRIVDTPGVGSIHSHNTAVARGFLSHVDAALCVLDVGQPLSEAERDLLLELAQRIPRLFVVVNKADQLTEAELHEAVEFIAAAVEVAVSGTAELFVVSARDGRGIGALRVRLRTLADVEQRDVISRSAAALAGAAAAAAQRTVELERTALLLPATELADRARDFSARIVELRAASEEAGDLLEHASKRVAVEVIERPLNDHMRARTPELRAALREHVAQFDGIAPHALASDLDAYIDTQVRSEFDGLVATLTAAVEGEVGRIQRRYANRIVEVLDAVTRAAADVFGGPGVALLPPSGLREPPRFTFKLEDPEHMLDTIVRVGQRRVPGRVGRHLVARAGEERLATMLDRHAGRLRSELVTRTTSTLRDYQRDLAAAVDGAIATIDGAVARAREEQQRGGARVRQRSTELALTSERLRELHNAFTAVASASAA
jgi:GTPase Era involved in 16S rRNA processing